MPFSLFGLGGADLCGKNDKWSTGSLITFQELSACKLVREGHMEQSSSLLICSFVLNCDEGDQTFSPVVYISV
jgi:hypothetical protein